MSSLPNYMRPLTHWPLVERRAIRGVMTDIDDTLTANGCIAPEALAALYQLREGGYAIIAISGRAAGWCAEFAQQWPLDALVAENGAVAFIRQPTSDPQAPSKIYQLSASQRQQNYAAMQKVVQTIQRIIPAAQLASDSWGRECDIAIDHSEHHHLTHAEIQRVVDTMRAAGMHATVSSIHINGWLGAHNKWQGANWIVHSLWQKSLR